MKRKSFRRKITYADAVNEALVQEMKRDRRVFVYGIDVADHKGIFGTTKNLTKRFGQTRCFSTPLSEDALLGFGLGAALNGLRPVNIHMRVDFLILAMNQLANLVTTYRYGSGGQTAVPITIRAIIGRGWGQGFQHSKSLQGFFAHIPGLKVIMPTTARDAKGMLVAAIRDPNPVLVIEHRWLYYQEGRVEENLFTLPLDKANTLRHGKDVTVIATSWMNVEAIKAADILKKKGVSVEVVDARSIYPLDEKTIIASVKKTRRCVIADYDWLYCGFASEVAATVSEKCFHILKTPVVRIGFPHVPCPTTRSLENEFFPNTGKIVRTIEHMFRLKPLDLSTETFYTYENKFKGPF